MVPHMSVHQIRINITDERDFQQNHTNKRDESRRENYLPNYDWRKETKWKRTRRSNISLDEYVVVDKGVVKGAAVSHYVQSLSANLTAEIPAMNED